MGHNHLPTLPTSIRWNAVVDSLRSGAPVGEVCALSVAAAERDLRNAAEDPVYREAVRLLCLIPQAARAPDFADGLRAIGLRPGDAPDLTDVVFAASDRLDEVAASSKRIDDFSELARRALAGALSECIGRELPGLLDVEPADVENAARRFAAPQHFTQLARSFYTRLLSETLSSFLDRTLADHVGPGERFAGVRERSEFDDALRLYCFETTRIVHEFSNGWYGKNVYQQGAAGLTADAVARFGSVALKKILSELQRKEPAIG